MSSRAALDRHIPAASSDRDRYESPPNPLWVIAIAMAVFFGATVALMMFD
jgi:hypothetical protein